MVEKIFPHPVTLNIVLVKAKKDCYSKFYLSIKNRYDFSPVLFEVPAHIRQLYTMYAEGKISPRITAVYPFERTLDALHALSNRTVKGKIVVNVGNRSKL